MMGQNALWHQQACAVPGTATEQTFQGGITVQIGSRSLHLTQRSPMAAAHALLRC